MAGRLTVPNTVDGLVLARLKSKRDLSDLLTDRKRIVTALRAQLLARSQADS